MPPPPKKPSRGLSLFGGGGGSGKNHAKADPAMPPPELKLEADRQVYRPGDPVCITLEINNPTATCSLLVEKLSFEIKGIEKLDTQWFNVPKSSPADSKQRRGEYIFMDGSAPSMVSNQILSSGATKKYVVRILLPTTLPPSYRGATIRYLYYVKSTVSGQYLVLETGKSDGESFHGLSELEARIPLQIWVTQKNNGLQSEEVQNDGIVPTAPVLLDITWKHMDGDSEWIRVNETFDGIEEGEGYESSRDEVSSVSSYNPAKDDLHRSFGSSLSMLSLAARSSNKDSTYQEGRASMSSFRALPRLSVAEVVHNSSEGVLSPDNSSAIISSNQQPKHAKSFSTNDLRVPSAPGTFEPGTSEGFVRGRSYNVRLDNQVLLRFSPKNSDSTYYFSDVIGGTLTFFHEEGARRCLELSVTLEMTETINRRFVHPSRRHSPTITKVHSDHQEVVADLVQTSFLFSVPMDGPMSFTTHYTTVTWALRFEFFTTPKNIDWTRFEHPLLVEGRDKCEWVLPITVHAPPMRASTVQTQNDKLFSLEPLWVRT